MWLDELGGGTHPLKLCRAENCSCLNVKLLLNYATFIPRNWKGTTGQTVAEATPLPAMPMNRRGTYMLQKVMDAEISFTQYCNSIMDCLV